MRVQDGLVFDAAVVMVDPKTGAAVGACVAVKICFSLSVRSWAKSSAIPFGVTVRKPSPSSRTSLPKAAGGHRFLAQLTHSHSDTPNPPPPTHPPPLTTFPTPPHPPP